MTEHAHLTLEALTAIDAGEDDAGLRIRTALAERCSRCLGVLADYLEKPARPAPRRTMWHRIERRLRARTAAVHGELAAANDLFEALADLSPEGRRTVVADPRLPVSRALIERLLDAARAACPADPAGSREWVALALTALDRARTGSPGQRPVALALLGNADRGLDDLAGAARAFSAARTLAGDPAESDLDLEDLAEVDRLEASLRIDLRQFEEAEALLLRALDAYRDLGQTTDAARTLLKLGHLFSNAGLPETAIGPYEAALDLLPRDLEPRLHLAARFNLAHCHFELGGVIEARDLLTYDEDLYERHADRHTTVRRQWLEGRIAAATGEVAEAEQLLLDTREVFSAQGGGFDAALVSMDLALLYQQLGRTGDLLETVTAAVQIFSAYALHREGLAALIMLRDAVRQKAATAETIERVARFLRESAGDPAARFQAPS